MSEWVRVGGMKCGAGGAGVSTDCERSRGASFSRRSKDGIVGRGRSVGVPIVDELRDVTRARGSAGRFPWFGSRFRDAFEEVDSVRAWLFEGRRGDEGIGDRAGARRGMWRNVDDLRTAGKGFVSLVEGDDGPAADSCASACVPFTSGDTWPDTGTGACTSTGAASVMATVGDVGNGMSLASSDICTPFPLAEPLAGIGAISGSSFNGTMFG